MQTGLILAGALIGGYALMGGLSSQEDDNSRDKTLKRKITIPGLIDRGLGDFGAPSYNIMFPKPPASDVGGSSMFDLSALAKAGSDFMNNALPGDSNSGYTNGKKTTQQPTESTWQFVQRMSQLRTSETTTAPFVPSKATMTGELSRDIMLKNIGAIPGTEAGTAVIITDPMTGAVVKK